MSLHRHVLAVLFTCAPVVFSQSFEASFSGGESYVNTKSANLGTYSPDPTSGTYTLHDGFRIALRMTLNQGRFFGHEFGYAYNHTSLDVPAAALNNGGISLPGTIPAVTNIGLPGHQGFYDFLAYAIPEGKRFRPFACGGVQFTAFHPEGSYGSETKYGINYGGGFKIKLMENWGLRFDLRQYNMSKPFNLPNASGRLLLYEFGVGVSFMM
ncbi:MAG TPA: outer membrane beta-barrel protein [Verrucomicrobiae bacterium]|nr:outer membrane beta-barrel protein [Verrucomicrobiae bacterium]